ncbi:MAG: Phosphoenolpyruvate-dihydroxyacetone phosphotransferase, ADP-binding subunit DhaL [Caproiciproducens sp.]|jgi:dihydroxyacetone kinase phosphoprotein-dependent L subunit|nr:Phosphoenolpyruvate-dihydroxyacetone phosphotransferase, ADP-binding subunit DhaL [Caproiciproducens sp.]
MKSIDIAQTKQMMICVADSIIESKSYLTEIDSQIGDGDHGIGMAGGLTKARAKLLETEVFEDVNQVFKAVGHTMLMSMGGASGVIFGTMIEGGAKTMDSRTVLDCATFTELMKGSQVALSKRDKAQVGDKTMLDAFVPAIEAMENAKTDDLVELLTLAEKAAKQGVENTKNYIAKFGRAKSLMERSIGFQDAGATSVWIIFRAMKEYLESI